MATYTYDTTTQEDAVLALLAAEDGITVEECMTNMILSSLEQKRVRLHVASETRITNELQVVLAKGGTFSISVDPDTGFLVGKEEVVKGEEVIAEEVIMAAELPKLRLR